MERSEDEYTVKPASSDESTGDNSSKNSEQQNTKPVLKEKSLKSDVVNKKTNSSEVEHSSRRNSRRLTSKGMKNESAEQTMAPEISQIKGTVKENNSNNCEGGSSDSGDASTTVLGKSLNKVKVKNI